MGNIRTVSLSVDQRGELERGYQKGTSHAFRKRCQLVLLKAQRRTSKEVGQIIGMHQVSVNAWLTRYEQEGITGLKTRPGRGRKPLFEPQRDAQKVREAVQQERQRLSQAKAMLEEQVGKPFSVETLKRFLKKTTAGTNDYA